MSTSTLLLSCPDRKGLVATMSQLLYEHNVNILDADQHTDVEEGMFFQRIRFDAAELNTSPDALRAAIRRTAAELKMSWELQDEGRTQRVALLVSKVDHCLYDLLLRHQAGELRCDIGLIVSNHETLRPVAEQFSVPFHHFPITQGTKRAQEEREVELLHQERIELVVLARYMQILSAEFVREFPSRIINIHHSFLPAFIGGKPYHQAYRRGVKLIGATAHYATTDLDEGPIIEQDVVRCSHRDAVRDLVRKGRDLERSVLGRAVRWHLEDRVLVYGNKTVVFD